MTRWTLRDYWQTDNSNELVMVIRNYHWLNSASRVLISTYSTPLVQIGEQFFIVWPWHMTLTYNPRLAKVKVEPYAKNQGQRSNGSNRKAPTDKRTDTHTDATNHIISPATWSITSLNPYWLLKKALIIACVLWVQSLLFTVALLFLQPRG